MTVYDGKDLTLEVAGLARRFGLRSVFRDVNFSCVCGRSTCVTGPNGSGKSTLLRIIAGLLAPSAGSVVISAGGNRTDASARRSLIRLVSADINLYGELTGLENLLFLTAVSGEPKSRTEAESQLAYVGLAGRGGDLVREYSSGMKQRLRLAATLMSEPAVLLLDEPSSMLDDEGRKLVYRVMEERKNRGILLYATNEQDELRLGDVIVRLG